jgi:hypothetical protein
MRSDVSNRVVTRVAPPGSAPAPLRSAVRRTQKRWPALMIGCGMLLAAVGTAAVVIATETSGSRPSSNSPRIAAAPDSDLRTAKITRDLGDKECSEQIFDNRTGRMTRSPQPCEAMAYDSNGVPIPLGTIHRLDAISKSFSSR